MSAAHTTLAEALAAAQAEFPPVDRDGINPHFRSRFTTLGHLLAKVRPVLNRHGLAVIQLPIQGENGQSMLRTTILHTSGELITADAPLLLARQDPQGQGSAITYMRRYALAAALGISDQDDDDGNAGSNGNTQAVPAGNQPPSPTAENGASLGGEGDPSAAAGGPDTAAAIDAAAVKELDARIRRELDLPIERVSLLFGAVEAEAPADVKMKTLRESLAGLTAAQGEQMLVFLKREAAKRAEEAEAEQEPGE